MFGRSIITESGSFASIRTRSFVSLEDEVSQEQNRTENCAQRRVSAGPVSDAPASVRYAINYWQSSGLFQSRSGDPLTVTSRANNNSLSGQNRDRAYLIGNPYGGSACSPTAHCKSFLNPACFQNNPLPSGPGLTRTYGNIVNGSFTGPRYTDVDMALAPNFPIREAVALQFRAEYSNLFNHTNFGDPTTSLGGSFGQITGTTPQNGANANDPRIAQFSLKLLF
jgi:hypothetical protein